MKYWGRKKENIKNVIILMIGLVALYSVTINLRRVEAADQIVTEKVVENEVIPKEEEQKITINTEELYKCIGAEVSHEEVKKALSYLPQEEHLEAVYIKEKGNNQGILIKYRFSNVNLLTVKKKQMILMDASVLLCLFPKVDAVKTVIIQNEHREEVVICREDLEDYFGIALSRSIQKNTFERVVSEFINLDHVNDYSNESHPYDSEYGEVVADFFKWEFPSIWHTGDEMPYIDEDLESDLVKSYGYKLFLQGLNYDNPVINYYCAYRLVECYGNTNLEEILLELSSCKCKTIYEEVEKACNFTINLLSTEETDEKIVVFSRYGETNLQGGKKLYVLMNGKLIELAKWSGKEPGGFEVISVSPNQKQVFCKVTIKDKQYFYVIPINDIAAYEVNEETVKSSGKIISKEIGALMEADAKGTLLEKIRNGSFKTNWFIGNILSLTFNQEHFIYNADKNQLMSEKAFNDVFDEEIFLTGLKDTYEEIQLRDISNSADVIKQVTIGNEKLVLYEYNSASKRESMQLIKDKNITIDGKSKKWSKGKIVVSYDGTSSQMIKVLDQIMAD